MAGTKQIAHTPGGSQDGCWRRTDNEESTLVGFEDCDCYRRDFAFSAHYLKTKHTIRSSSFEAQHTQNCERSQPDTHTEFTWRTVNKLKHLLQAVRSFDKASSLRRKSTVCTHSRLSGNTCCRVVATKFPLLLLCAITPFRRYPAAASRTLVPLFGMRKWPAWCATTGECR